MSRTFWFAAGATTAMYVYVKARRTAENFTPDGVAARVAAWREGARLFTAEVATGMAEREAELRHEAALPVPARKAQGAIPQPRGNPDGDS